MSKPRLTFVLLKPSLSSGVVCLALTILFLGTADWAFAAHSSWFYTYWFGPYGLVTALHAAPQGLSGYKQVIFAHSLLHQLTSFGFVLMIGVVAYSALQLVNFLLNGVLDTWLQAHIAQESAKKALSLEVWRRFMLRLAIGVVCVLYLAVFWRLILPFCISDSRYGTAILPSLSGWSYTIGSFALLLAALHVQIILIRLLFLRPRIFGGADVLILAERH